MSEKKVGVRTPAVVSRNDAAAHVARVYLRKIGVDTREQPLLPLREWPVDRPCTDPETMANYYPDSPGKGKRSTTDAGAALDGCRRCSVSLSCLVLALKSSTVDDVAVIGATLPDVRKDLRADVADVIEYGYPPEEQLQSGAE